MKTDSNIKRVKVLGVGIDDVSKEEALKKVENWLCHDGDPDLRQDDNMVSFRRRPESLANASKLIFTPGPEFLVTAQKDPEFKKILNSADLNLSDGYGLKIFGGITHVVPGVEFMLGLCEMATKKSLTVGLLGGSAGVAKKTKEKLGIMFPEINITFAIDGQEADRLIEDYDTLRYVDILFVALGHPRQEKLLWNMCHPELVSGSLANARNYSNKLRDPDLRQDDKTQARNDSFCVGMGVGGSFDLISGKLSRAPGILRKLGLEWLWRLIQETERFKRIFRAIVIFPLMVFRENLLL